MAIAILDRTDTATDVVDQTSVSNLTWNVTLTNSTNNCLFVQLHTLGAEIGGASGITYNSVALTKVGSSITSFGGGGYDPSVETWRLLNPSTGSSYSLAITLSGTMHVASANVVHLSGVDQTTPTEDSQGVASTSSSISDTCTVTTANAMVLQAWCGKNAAAGVTQDNSQTEWTDQDTAGSSETLAWSDAYLANQSAGVVTAGVSSINADNNVIHLVVVKPASASASASHRMFQVF